MLENLLVTLAVAGVAWLLAVAISSTTMLLFWFARRTRAFFLGLFVALGLIPAIIMGPLLRAVSQPEIDLRILTLFPIEVLLIGLVCCVAPILSIARAANEVEARYGALITVSAMSRTRAFKDVCLPYTISSALPPLRAAVPLAILLVVLMEWGRGYDDGLGAYTQGIVQGGDWVGRWILIIMISVPSLLAYIVLEMIENRWNSRFHISHQAETSFRVQDADQSDWAQLMLGIIFGCVIVLTVWHFGFSNEAIDRTQRFTPMKFFESLAAIGDREIISASGGMRLEPRLLAALRNTMFLAIGASVIGVLFAGAIALTAQRFRSVKHGMTAFSAISQSVPIFLFIPFFLSFFDNRAFVALLVCISVTYFVAYEIFLAKLTQVPDEWDSLRTMTLKPSGASGTVSNFVRSLCFWYYPLMRSMAIIAVVVVLPSGIIAAIVADIFLFLGGLANLAFYEGQTDVFVNLLVVVLLFVLMLLTYLVGRLIEQQVVS